MTMIGDNSLHVTVRYLFTHVSQREACEPGGSSAIRKLLQTAYPQEGKVLGNGKTVRVGTEPFRFAEQPQ